MALPIRSAATCAKAAAAALEAMWALYGCAGFDETPAEALLDHPDADVRSWCVRLLGDEPTISRRAELAILELAGREPDVSVRSQLACTARRLRLGAGLISPGGCSPAIRTRVIHISLSALVGRRSACARRC